MNTKDDHIVIDPNLLHCISPDIAWNHMIIPKSQDQNTLEFYSASNDSDFTREELEVLLNSEIVLVETDIEIIRPYLSRNYRRTEQKESASFSARDKDFLTKLILEARELGSSDIHLENYGDKGRVRIRIDGHLIEKYAIKSSSYAELVNKVKITANIDIAEKRLPQDGRIEFRENEEEFDIRVSTLPTLKSEKVVMRILSSDAGFLELNKLGFNDLQLTRYRSAVKRPNGIVLISGPTGSGKTTTLYATLKLLNEEKRNIMTIEDPIEYTLQGINQVQLRENIGLTFPKALRTFLRQDPDIIMVGEIRDKSTAEMAIKASLTGHLVFSTIHTNSAWGTISRLIDMGVPAYLIANTLTISMAQRLLRMLCEECKVECNIDQDQLPNGYSDSSFLGFAPGGCERCHYTGYKGRKAIYELIPVDKDIQRSIREDAFEVNDLLKSKQVSKLHEQAFELLRNGMTSVEEAYPLLMDR